MEINNFEFSNASIDVSKGDISIQSTKKIKASLELLNPSYCLSSYKAFNKKVEEKPSQECSKVYSNDSNLDEQNVIAERCYNIPDIELDSAGSEDFQILNAKNTYGNIYINLL